MGRESDVINPEILRSWRRTRDLHRIDPKLGRAPILLGNEALQDRREASDVYRLAAPVLDDLGRPLALVEQVLGFFDADGCMLSLAGHPAVLERVSEIAFQPGADWSEAAVGTNAPGTALADAIDIEVFASEHFVEAWQPWTCAAAPIFEPGSDRPVAVIDITAPWRDQRFERLVAARAIARTVEERLRAAWSVRDEVVRHALRMARERGDALFAIDGRGRVLAANDAARRILETSGVRAQSDALATELRRAAASSESDVSLERAGLPSRYHAVASPIRHDASTVGAVVRLTDTRAALRGGGSRTPPSRHDFERILGHSAPLTRAVEQARIAAGNDLPVVLCGESGTGKELFVQAIHAASRRSAGPLVAVNCGAIPGSLMEAELFGYEPGAFTGGRREGNRGKFEVADGGTLFLDEVSELSSATQTALLRVLQEKEVVRIGGSSPRRLDVRVVAATNRPLEQELAAGRFRHDLYYRLNVLAIAVPPLRERGDDVDLLAQIFLAEAEAELSRSGLAFTPQALSALRSYGFPGNVRELRNLVLRAAATTPGRDIDVSDLTSEVNMVPPRSPPTAARAPAPLIASAPDRAALERALDSAGWNVSRTAKALGVARVTLYRWLEKHGMSRNPSARSDAASCARHPPG